MKPAPNFLYKSERHTMDMLLFRVCDYYQVSYNAVQRAQRGSPQETHARQVCMYLFHAKLGSSCTAIGAYFQRDHSTVLHALDRVALDDEKLNEYALIVAHVDKVGITHLDWEQSKKYAPLPNESQTAIHNSSLCYPQEAQNQVGV